MKFNFCLESIIALGPLSLFKEASQHSKVSFISAGLKTFKFGIALKLDKCSMGWCVGPSSLIQSSHEKKCILLVIPLELKV